MVNAWIKSENGKEMNTRDIKGEDNQAYGNWLVEEREEKKNMLPWYGGWML